MYHLPVMDCYVSLINRLTAGKRGPTCHVETFPEPDIPPQPPPEPELPEQPIPAEMPQ